MGNRIWQYSLGGAFVALTARQTMMVSRTLGALLVVVSTTLSQGCATEVDGHVGRTSKALVVSRLKRPVPHTPLLAILELDAAVDMLTTLQAMPASDPRVLAFDEFRLSAGAPVLCRAEEVQLAAMDVVNTALVKLGVSSSLVGNLMTRHRAVHSATCDAQAALDWARFRGDVAQGILLTEDLLEAIAAITGGSLEQAAIALDRLGTYALAELATTCGTRGDELLAFVRAGIQPNGKTATQLLFGTCGTTPSGVASAIGISGMPQTTGQALEACMNDMVAEQQTCSDPRAQGSPETPPAPEPECDADCKEQEKEHQSARDRLVSAITSSFVSETNLSTFVRDSQAEENSSVLKLYGSLADFWASLVGVDLPVEVLGRDAREKTWLKAADKVLDVSNVIIDVVTIAGEAKTQDQRTEYWKKELEDQQRNTNELCRQLGASAPPQCNRRCPEFDFGDLSAFYATNDLRGAPRQINDIDRVNHCLCKHLGERFTGSGCESPEDREKQECLRNPDEPNGAPKTHCMKYLQPMDLDMGLLRARRCDQTYPNCNANADYMTVDGTCGCGDIPLTEADRSQFCGKAHVTDCGPDSTLDLKTCQCQGLGNGAPAFGTQGPGCLLLPDNFGANVRPMLTPRPEVLMTDVLTTSTGIVPVIRTEPGFQPFATNAVRIADFPSRLGESVRLDVDFPAELAALTSGRTLVNVSVLSASQPSSNMINQTIGVIAHSTLEAGRLNPVSLTLPPSVRERLTRAEVADDDVYFIFVNDTALDLPTTPGLARFDLGGALRPVSELSPFCERPGPSPRPTPVVTPSPFDDLTILTVPGNTATLWPFQGL